MTRARLSDDGRSYWDGDRWVPVPGVDRTPPSVPFAAEQPDRATALPVDSADVDFGPATVVTDDALAPVRRTHQRAVALVLVLTPLLVVVTDPAIWSLARHTDAVAGQRLVDVLAPALLRCGAGIAAALAVLELARQILPVRLYVTPRTQATAAALAAALLVAVASRL